MFGKRDLIWLNFIKPPTFFLLMNSLEDAKQWDETRFYKISSGSAYDIIRQQLTATALNFILETSMFSLSVFTFKKRKIYLE